jgi:hypothetical protein
MSSVIKSKFTFSRPGFKRTIKIRSHYSNSCTLIRLNQSELFKDGAPFISGSIKIDFATTKDYECFDIKSIKQHLYYIDCYNHTDTTNFWISVNFEDDKNPLYEVIQSSY